MGCSQTTPALPPKEVCLASATRQLSVQGSPIHSDPSFRLPLFSTSHQPWPKEPLGSSPGLPQQKPIQDDLGTIPHVETTLWLKSAPPPQKKCPLPRGLAVRTLPSTISIRLTGIQLTPDLWGESLRHRDAPAAGFPRGLLLGGCESWSTGEGQGLLRGSKGG